MRGPPSQSHCQTNKPRHTKEAFQGMIFELLQNLVGTESENLGLVSLVWLGSDFSIPALM